MMASASAEAALKKVAANTAARSRPPEVPNRKVVSPQVAAYRSRCGVIRPDHRSYASGIVDWQICCSGRDH